MKYEIFIREDAKASLPAEDEKNSSHPPLSTHLPAAGRVFIFPILARILADFTHLC